MRLTSLSLRNYRVFESLDLELPPGVVGVYGANGAGKSTLLEAVLWALYGRARTSKAEIRTSGATAECVAEVGFEHDGHHYAVRRSISGVSATVRARATAGGQVVADGVGEVGRYVRSVLGMDEAAFRASVFAEQKQLAAFSESAPEQRRRLVLQLLGITPLERARDAARADARARRGERERLTGLLPDLDELARVTGERVSAATVAAERAAQAEAVAQKVLVTAEDARRAVTALEQAKVAYDLVVQRGASVRAELDRAGAAVAKLEAEIATLAVDEARLAALAEAAAGVTELEARHRLLAAHAAALAAVERVGTVPEVEPPDAAEQAAAQARDAREAAAAALARAEAEAAAAAMSLDRARSALRASDQLTPGADCPLCGQELGDGFETVRKHRQVEAEAAEAAVVDAQGAVTTARSAATQARAAAADAERAAGRARAAFDAAATTRAHAAAAADALARAAEALGGAPLPGETDAVATALQAARDASAEHARVLGRLERAGDVRARLDDERARRDTAARTRDQLLAEVAALGFRAADHAAANETAARAQADADRARTEAGAAQAAWANAQAQATAAEAVLEQGRAQHRALDDLTEEVRHLARAAELLAGFRQAVVGTIGPLLSVQASELFAELTAGEYDGLEVDPETYEIRIVDQGVAYPTARFSGSEVDLANLALRVAISEQVRFQTGGQVGLLVLDEALASLDGDRKDRMLAALSRLSGRFRQILVVTHAPEVKERLPQAIEVVKTGRRRSTARVLDA